MHHCVVSILLCNPYCVVCSKDFTLHNNYGLCIVEYVV